MIILTKEKLENNEQILNIIDKERKLLLSTIDSQKALKCTFLDYMQKLVLSTDNVDSSRQDSVLNIFKNFENILNLLKINQDLLDDLLKSLDNIELEFCNKDKAIDLETINNFNAAFFETNETVSQNTIQIESFLQSMLQFSEFIFSNTISYDDTKEDEFTEISASNDSVQHVEAPTSKKDN